MEIKEGILNSGKGKRPFKVMLNDRKVSFASHDKAKAARDAAHAEAMEEAQAVMEAQVKWR